MLYDGAKPEIQIAENELITDESFLQSEWSPKPESSIDSLMMEPSAVSNGEVNLSKQRVPRSRRYIPGELSKVRDRWRESHVMPDSFFEKNDERLYKEINSITRESVDRMNKTPDTLFSMDSQNIDMRPHIFDKKQTNLYFSILELKYLRALRSQEIR